MSAAATLELMERPAFGGGGRRSEDGGRNRILTEATHIRLLCTSREIVSTNISILGRA